MSAVLPPSGGFSFPAQQRPAYKGSAQGGQRGTGLALVVGLHVLAAWALASGLAREAFEIVKKPIEMSIITEAPPPPPSPPPPKIEKIKEVPKIDVPPPPPAYVPPPEVVVAPPPAPVIQAVQAEPPKEPVVIAPPPPPAPPAPQPRPAIVKQEISVACPGYQNVLAAALEEAIERVGLTGTVQALIKIRGTQVADVQTLSGPKEYYKYVQAAVKRMRCSAGGAEEVQVALPVIFAK